MHRRGEPSRLHSRWRTREPRRAHRGVRGSRADPHRCGDPAAHRRRVRDAAAATAAAQRVRRAGRRIRDPHDGDGSVVTRLSRLVGASVLAAAATPARADLEDVAGKLTWSNANGSVVANLSMIADTTLYAQDAPAQGLLFSDNDVYFAPRVATFAEVGFGDRLLLHAQLTADRGFDP